MKILKSIALIIICVELFSGCEKPQIAGEDVLAAEAFRYGCALSWQEISGIETMNQFTLRMAERALQSSTNDMTKAIWLEAIRQTKESQKPSIK